MWRCKKKMWGKTRFITAVNGLVFMCVCFCDRERGTVIWGEVVCVSGIRGSCVKMSEYVCVCMAVNWILEHGKWKWTAWPHRAIFVLPSISQSHTHTQFWIPLTPSFSLNFTPPFYFSSCHLPPFTPCQIYVTHLLPHKPSQTTPSSIS